MPLDLRCHIIVALTGPALRTIAVAVFSRALEFEPGLIWSHRGRGAAYLRIKQYDEAIADLETALELAGEAGALDGDSLVRSQAASHRLFG